MNLLYNLVKLKKSSFFRRLSVLVSGNVVARMFPIVLLPVLSRIYTVENFAQLGIFTSLIAILNTLTSGNYEYAIIIPEDETEAKKIKIISMYLCILASLLIFIILILIKESVKVYFHTENHLFFLIFIPGSLIVNTFMQIQTQWAVRKQYFNYLSISHVLNTAATAGIQIVLGFVLNIGSGLIIGTISGNLITALFLFVISTVKEKFEDKLVFIKLNEIIYLLKKYKDFPLFKMPGIFVNKLQDSIPILIFNLTFSQSFLGYYSMSRKILAIPIGIVGRSAGNIFVSEAALRLRKTGSCFDIYKKTLMFLLVTGFLGSVALFIFIPYLVPIFLGKEWVGLDLVIRIMTIRLLSGYISSPLSGVFRVTGRLKQNFIFQIIQAIVIIGTLFIISRMYDENSILIFFSLISTVFYTIYIILGYKSAESKI